MSDPVTIVDGHLDVAHNSLRYGRDLTLSLDALRASEPGEHPNVAMTTLDTFGRGGVGIVFATLYASPAVSWDDPSGIPEPSAGAARRYSTPKEAESIALDQLDLYRRWADDGRIRLILDVESLDRHLAAFARDGVPGFLIAMEGADPIVRPEDLNRWFERGLRMVGLCWGSTRYAGGTGASSALTPAGRELLAAMTETGVIHDAVHLSEESFWEAAGLPHHALCVSHGNARSLMRAPGVVNKVPLNRFLSDAQVVEVSRARGAASRGVIGVALINDFLDPRWSFDAEGRRHHVSLHGQGAAHLHHFAALAGWESVAIGSDVDAGFGRDETAAGLDSVLDWHRIGDCVPTVARNLVLGDNWLRFLRETLPRAAA